MTKLTKEIYESEKRRISNDERYTQRLKDWLLGKLEKRWIAERKHDQEATQND